MKNGENKSNGRHGHQALCLLEKRLARGAQKMMMVGI